MCAAVGSFCAHETDEFPAHLVAATAFGRIPAVGSFSHIRPCAAPARRGAVASFCAPRITGFQPVLMALD